MKKQRKIKVGALEIVSPSKKEEDKLLHAVEFLKETEEMYYMKLLKTLRAIIVVDSPKGYENELFPEQRIWVTESGTVQKSHEWYLASLLLHELIHMEQYENGNAKWSEQLEKEAYERQKKFLQKLNYTDAVQHIEEEFKKKWWGKGVSYKNRDMMIESLRQYDDT